MQENHYYPFGMVMNGPWMDDTARNMPYQYNGKELNEDFGLNWNDFGFRWYDATLGRFPSVDPIISEFPYLTPYNYASNSPISKIDLHGLQGLDVNLFWGTISGMATAAVEDLTGVELPSPQANDSYSNSFREAEQFTHAGLAVTGVALMEVGAGVAAGGGTVALTGVGAPVGAPAAAVGAGTAVAGTWLAANATRNFMNGNQNNSIDDIPKPEKGKGSVPPDQRDPKRSATKSERQELLDDQGGRCAGCNQPKNVDEVQAHHKQRHADGGPTEKFNLTALCPECHITIHK